MRDSTLRKLAKAAGLILEWDDSEGRTLHLSPEIQRILLPLLGFPVDSEEAMDDSLRRLQRWNHPETPAQLPPLITADQDVSIALPCPIEPGTPYVLTLESGQSTRGEASKAGKIAPIGEPGYHQLEIDGASLTLAVAPPQCFSPADACGSDTPRLWGLAVQLYSLRRPGDGGFGDAQALEHLARSAARQGAAAVAVSPTHAMFTTDPEHYSPYSPSSRLLRNVLYCSPEGIIGKQKVEAAIERCQLASELRALESSELIDWPAAARAKLTWLRALYEDFSGSTDPELEPMRQRLAAFRADGGEMLEDHCRFEALLAHQGPGSWRDWPEEYRDPRSAEVEQFAAQHAYEVEFHVFLQWLAGDSLGRAQAATREAGMPIGLIADLAVGADGAGSQTWSRQGEMLEGVSIGAPPDTFNVHGQDWGLCAFSPYGLVQSGFRSFIDMLRVSFSDAGGLRIDHILGLLRLWLVPHGLSPDQGGYLRYPLDDLLRLVALESLRHRAIVVGEDLGTVAAGFSEQLAARGILGMKVLWFERAEDGEFQPAEKWSAEALATTTTHDLPTVAGWWAGRDIDWRGRLGLLPEDQPVEAERQARAEGRAQLAYALGLARNRARKELEASDLPTSQVLEACARHLGRTPAPLAILPVEDVLGLEEQANLPGAAALNEHPNWCRRWSPDAPYLLDPAEVRHRLKEFARGREESASATPSRRESKS